MGLVAALVLGIFAMHALTSHGSSMSPTAAVTATSAGQRADQTVHEPQAAMTAGMSSQSTQPAHVTGAGAHASQDSGMGHSLGAMVMLCLVMLAAAALTLLVLLATGGVRRMRLKVFEPLTITVRTLTWIRSNGPPPAWEFSVIRC